MKNKFLVLNIKEITKYSLLTLALITCVSLGSKYTNKVIETSANNRLLPIYSVERDDKKVALTFDCAWGADDIEEIVDTLEFNNIKATFFCVGTWVDKYPEVVKLISEGENDIGNHSNSHAHVNKLSYEENIEDMKKCNEKIEALTGRTVTLYRGPYGEYNNTVIKSAEDLKMKAIQWDVDTLDWKGLSAMEITNRVLNGVRNGSIILCHNNSDHILEALPIVLDRLSKKGYKVTTVGELIYKSDYFIDNNGMQSKKI